MRAQSYLLSAQQILEQYKGEMPLAGWLKGFFKQYKKYGSRDRKVIAHLCYCYYRLGAAFADKPVTERMTIGLFLTATEPGALLGELQPAWNDAVHLPPEEKLKLIDRAVMVRSIFPWNSFLSNEIDTNAFNQSLLVQPKVYLRVRPGRWQYVTKALTKNGIAFEQVSEHCLAVDQAAKVDAALELDCDAVVQDKSSQQVLDLLDKKGKEKKLSVWDCCAASGGKSLLLLDRFENISLTVSDVRTSILANLRNRFAKAGVKNYNWFVGDAAKAAPPQGQKFDLIICDAPCSGSGTWSRTPEQLLFFTAEKIDYYAQLQKSIAHNVSKSLKPGGSLLYITCSVFQKENEEVVAYLQQNGSLQLKATRYFKGYTDKADTLFAALFTAS